MEFQLGEFPFSRLNSSFTGGVYNQFSSAVAPNSPTTFNTTYPSANSSSIMGMNYLSSSNVKQGEIESFNNVGIQGMSSMNFNTSLASSIESLSCMNQDLHWRLQQQRFAEMLSEENHHRESSVSLIPDATLENQVQRPEPIFFQNLEISKPVASAVGNTGECFFDNSSYTPTSTTTFKNGDENTSNWSGFQAWNDVHQYGALP
ncbi:hypothetical protein IFM89_034640 [Coptis chinensis]|uniref:Uncharacterized protein n=1 Tax=Coptis chinensis TaxID=261450 RepID=A0A835HR10_9MAGN|nr:hypothetical protein IFM89_034640 [Coptis chinensis]